MVSRICVIAMLMFCAAISYFHPPNSGESHARQALAVTPLITGPFDKELGIRQLGPGTPSVNAGKPILEENEDDSNSDGSDFQDSIIGGLVGGISGGVLGFLAAIAVVMRQERVKTRSEISAAYFELRTVFQVLVEDGLLYPRIRTPALDAAILHFMGNEQDDRVMIDAKTEIDLYSYWRSELDDTNKDIESDEDVVQKVLDERKTKCAAAAGAAVEMLSKRV